MTQMNELKEIGRMQEHLLLIRRAVGWTAEEFGDHIGVTRQTINNLENGRGKLSKTQYIAMRSVLDAEAAREPEGMQMVQLLLEVLVDHPEKYSPEERTEVLSKANLITPSILTGTATRETASKELFKTLGPIAGGALAAALVAMFPAGAVCAWLAKLVTDKFWKK